MTSLLLRTATLVAVLVLRASSARAVSVGLPLTLSGGGASWTISNTGGTTGSVSARGGMCDGSAGFTVQDASLGTQTDAFDNALTLWIASNQFVAGPSVELNGVTVTAGPLPVPGFPLLEVTIEHTALIGSPILRTLVTMSDTDPTFGLNFPVEVASNLGSDEATGVRLTSNGDATIDFDDRWVVTSDDPTMPHDPVVTQVLGGPGVPVARHSVSDTVFQCLGARPTNTQGIVGETRVGLEAGETRYLLYFTRLDATITDALAGALSFDENPALDSELLQGLTLEQLRRVVNWDFSQGVDLHGGGPGVGSTWKIRDSGAPDARPPEYCTEPEVSPMAPPTCWRFGECNARPGLTVEDATLADRGHAFDNGLTLWVDNVMVPGIELTGDGHTATARRVLISGLDVSVEYTADPGSPTLRTVATFANPSPAPITTTVAWATNIGADSMMAGVRASSSGDMLFGDGDRWVVTSDDPDSTTLQTLVDTHVLAGVGHPVALPSNVSSEVFGCHGSQGIGAEYTFTMPAGNTRRLLFFNQLSLTNEEAVAAAAAFNDGPHATDALLRDLVPAVLRSVVNWDFCATDGAAFCDDGVACTVDGCADGGGCSHVPDAARCDDGIACTVDDCDVGGGCRHAPDATLCDDGDACTVEACAADVGCVHTPLPRAVEFLSVRCRLSALQATVQAGVPSGKLARGLAKALATAETLRLHAETLHTGGHAGPAGRALRRAAKRVGHLRRRLRTRAARRQIAAEVQAALAESAEELGADLVALAKAR